MKFKPYYVKKYLSSIDKYVSTSITDCHGVILYASSAFCDMNGYSQEELIGQKHSMLRHPDMPASTYKNLWETITKGEIWQGRIKNLKKNGDAYWVDAFIEAIYNKNAIVAYHAVRKNITDEKLYKKLAHTDPLTALYNRSSIESFADLLLEDFRTKAYIFSIIMIDIDDFKAVNDTFGHLMGDSVLKKVAEIARSLIRSSDRMGRWGGEEFIALLPQTSYKQAKELAERLRAGFSLHHFDGVERVTASFGVATIESDKNFHALVQRADEALYLSKEMGKNRVS